MATYRFNLFSYYFLRVIEVSCLIFLIMKN